jgi:hypothetical protein
MAHDKKLSRFITSNGEQMIPLGIQINSPMYTTFNVIHNSGFSKVILVDTQTGYEHDLLANPYTADILPKGVCEGRYFLNIASDNWEYDEDDDVTTSVDNALNDSAISIYTVPENNAVQVVANNVTLQKILVSDMMGRTLTYESSGNSALIHIPNAMGIYIIQVIGDNATRTEKVILK